VKTSASVLVVGVSILVGVLVALAGSSGGLRWSGFPIFAWGALLIFLVQWAVFVPSWFAHTEHFFDLTGSLTYLAVITLTLLSRGPVTPYCLLVAAMVAVWALRLGTFLAARVRAAGSDSRFDVMKHRFAWFLMTWTLQGLWVLLTAGAALAAITSSEDRQIDALALLGIGLWAFGFGIEVTADEQKRRFRTRPENLDRFIATGLWARSRHPNYFGEILLWFGVAITAFPSLSGWSTVTLVSPLFVWLLLTRVSGVPLLEATADRRWAGNPEYEAYKAATPLLLFRVR